jgi:hypothetical protein
MNTGEIENTVLRNLKALGIALQVLAGHPEVLNEYKKKVSAVLHAPEEVGSSQNVYTT